MGKERFSIYRGWTGNGYPLWQNNSATKVEAIKAAKAYARNFNPSGHVISVWNDLTGKRVRLVVSR